VKIAEADYLYGIGDLVLRVAETASVQHLPDGDWLNVRGVQLAWNGAELRERQVLVRLGARIRRPG